MDADGKEEGVRVRRQGGACIRTGMNTIIIIIIIIIIGIIIITTTIFIIIDWRVAFHQISLLPHAARRGQEAPKNREKHPNGERSNRLLYLMKALVLLSLLCVVVRRD